LEHPTATSLLPLARTSEYFVVNHATNTSVGENHVNITNLMKRATRLSPETQVTLGGYYGGHLPPPKWSHFFAKKKQLTRAKHVSTSASSKTRTGRRQPSGKDARARDSPRLREDTTLLSCLQPSRPLAKIELPYLEFTQEEGETKKCNKVKNAIPLSQTSEEKVICLFTRPHGPHTNT
jgi:hypothetical protein